MTPSHPDVSVKISGLITTLNNGLIKITFNSDATVSSLYISGKNLLDNVADRTSFYLDWNNGTFDRFSPSSLQLLKNSTEHVHIMYLQDVSGFLKYEYHIIMKKGLSGFYTYVTLINNKDHPISLAETRVIYRFDPRTMHQVTNSVQEGILPDANILINAQPVQDTTWKFVDGRYYSKYDYAGYLRNSSYVGVFGHGYGAWLISTSREYHSGGPLKQDILVHEVSLISNYMTGKHFGTPNLNAPVGWSKIYGPWLMYFNEGTDFQMKADTIRQVNVEKNLWPYNWMNESDYPLKRGSLTGQIVSSVRSMVVLSSSLTEDFDLQTLGFSYSTETNENCDFQLDNIRPETYKLTAYPIEGYGIGYQSEKLISIIEGKNRAILNLSVPKDVKWSIGETNRRSDSYRYSNEKRNYIWHTLPPADLEFEIGKSDIHTDWYYAQTNPGTWNITYTDTVDGKNRILRIGIAAASTIAPSAPGAASNCKPDDPTFPKVAVSVNGHLMNEYQYEDDSAVHRSAPQSGNYHPETIIFPANLVIEGRNVVSLTLRRGSLMYDSINLSIGK